MKNQMIQDPLEILPTDWKGHIRKCFLVSPLGAICVNCLKVICV